MRRAFGVENGESSYTGRDTGESTAGNTPYPNKDNEQPLSGPHFSPLRVIGNGAFGKIFVLSSLKHFAHFCAF